jgi:hypothetical protein
VCGAAHGDERSRGEDECREGILRILRGVEPSCNSRLGFFFVAIYFWALALALTVSVSVSSIRERLASFALYYQLGLRLYLSASGSQAIFSIFYHCSGCGVGLVNSIAMPYERLLMIQSMG